MAYDFKSIRPAPPTEEQKDRAIEEAVKALKGSEATLEIFATRVCRALNTTISPKSVRDYIRELPEEKCAKLGIPHKFWKQNTKKNARVEERLDAVFQLLEEVTTKGGPCPSDDQMRVWMAAKKLILPSAALATLANQGKILLMVYPGNIRVIKILTGPHAGAFTERPPGQPMRVVGKEGPLVARVQRTAPTARKP